MKKILFFLTTVLLFISFVDLKAQAVNDWNWSHPKVTGQTLRWCQMFNASTYYAVGYGGNFFKTTDGGTTWKHQVLSIPYRATNSTLYDAHFFNMNTGVAAGYMRLFRTTNGGDTWDTCAGTVTQTSSHYKFSFINSNTGFVAGASGRVFKTTNGGVSWAPTPDPQAGTSTKYSCYFINANTGMVGESSADIWRTTNGGANWYEFNGSGGSVYCINFINSTTGFFCGSSTTLYKTTNAGVNWTQWKTGLPSASYYDIDFGPAVMTGMANESFTGTAFPPAGWRRVNLQGSNQWLRYTSLYHTSPASARISYQSTGGHDWLITKGINVGGSDSLVFWARRYYTSIYNPDSLIVRVSTTDTAMSSFTNILGKYNVNSFGTTTWSRVALPMGTYAGNAWVAFQHKDNDGNGLLIDDVSVGLNSPPPSPTVYVTGNPFAIYRSPSAPSTPSWDTLGFLSTTQPITSTYYSTSLGGNGDSLFTVGALGLMNKRNNASNRVCFRTGWPYYTSSISGFGVIGNRIIATTEGYYTIFVSTNSGTTWDTTQIIPGTSSSYDLNDISTYGNNAWICGYSGKVFKSTNGGVSWSEIFDIGSYELMDIDFVNANTGWVVGYSGRCYKTTNGGTNFTMQTTPGVTSTIYGISMVNANTGWFCGSSGKISKTTNGGTNWVAQTSQYTSTLRGIDFVNANTGWAVGYTSTIRKTTNGGTNWDTLHVPFTPYSSYYAVDFVDPYNGMIVGSYGQTIRTQNGGTTWHYENTGGNSQYALKMTSTDSGWAGSSSGYIFKYAEQLTGGNTYTHVVPETYELNQNYPNPFNPVTTIQFALPKAGRVSLKVYDVSGRLVRTLFNNEGLNEGTFKHIFDGSSVASGVYFYSLIVDGNLIDTKKMVLIK